MADDSSSSFLHRWSRRKHEAARAAAAPAAPVAAPSAPATPAAPVAAAAEAPLPAVESLTFESDFTAFLSPKVDELTKRAALKKLFSDPRFNVMDGLDIYIDDYSKPDPLPASMLRQMASAKFLKMFDDEEEEEEKKAAQAKAAAQNLEEPRDDADTPAGQAVAQSDLCKQLPSQPESPALPASQPLDAHTDLRLQPDHAPAGREPGQGAG